MDILLSQITRNNLNPGQIIVEVTEDEVISGYEEFTWAIRQLRAAGIGLAIDDFGSGFAGLSLLAKLPPTTVLRRSRVNAARVTATVVTVVTAAPVVKMVSATRSTVQKPQQWRPRRVLLRKPWPSLWHRKPPHQ